jgi:eukaryotic-like serine/threonine-protein kinase
MNVTAQLAASLRHDRLRCATCGKNTLSMIEPEKLPALAHPPQEISEYLIAEQQKTKMNARADDTPSGGGEPFGRYELLRVLGAGGMAEAYLARQRSLGGFEKNVVVKRLLPHLSADQSFITMLLEEARVAARISHPNVVQIFDLGQVENRYFIAMEYIRGKDLSSILRAATRLQREIPIELAARIISDICAGLHAAHTCTDESGKPFPIIHRDVSPHNVLVSIEGRVVLTDFGIAKAVDSAAQTPTSLLKGKLAYLAPEQLQLDGRPIDARADLFPTGLIFFQLLTHEHMFKRDTEYATLKAILHDPIVPVERKRPDVPPDLSRILMRALERNPDNRYESAQEFHTDLETFLKNFPKPSGAPELANWINELLRAESELPTEQPAKSDSERDLLATAEFRDPRSV